MRHARSQASPVTALYRPIETEPTLVLELVPPSEPLPLRRRSWPPVSLDVKKLPFQAPSGPVLAGMFATTVALAVLACFTAALLFQPRRVPEARRAFANAAAVVPRVEVMEQLDRRAAPEVIVEAVAPSPSPSGAAAFRRWLRHRAENEATRNLP